jgi:hypothetical protein
MAGPGVRGRGPKDLTDEDILTAQIVSRFVKGMSAESIAKELKCDHWAVHVRIRRTAEEVRDNLREEVEEGFLQQHLGLKHLIARCMEAIERAASHDPPHFDDRAVKSLIMVYDRQSKLLGCDKGRESVGRGEYAWMQGATEDDLRREALRRGIRLPEPIVPDA